MKLAVAFALEPYEPPPPKTKKKEEPPPMRRRTSAARLRRKMHAWRPPKGEGALCGAVSKDRPARSLKAALREASTVRGTWVPELVNCGKCMELMRRDPAVARRMHKARQLPIW